MGAQVIKKDSLQTDTLKMVNQGPAADTLKVVIKTPAPDSVKIQPKVKTPFAQFFVEKDFFPNHTLFSPIDTALDGIQRYFPNNYPYSIGSLNRKLVFEPDFKIGFRSGLESLDLFGYNNEEIRYFQTRTPYTDVFVLFGSKKEQFARLIHTQNITRRWNVAFNLLRIRSEGFYQRQSGTDNNVSLSSNYTSRNNRYSFLINGIVTSIKNEENGGIGNDTLYEENLFVNKKLMGINLLDARTQRSSKGVYMAHFLNFGKRDTAKMDSTTRRQVLPTTSLSYSFGLKGSLYMYMENDPLSGYYDQTMFDTVLTEDSTHMRELEHGLNLQTLLLKRIKINAGIKQVNTQYVQYNADSSLAIDTLFSDQIFQAEIGNILRKNKTSGFLWSFGKRYVLAGSHEGEDYFHLNLGYVFKKSQKISFDYKSTYHAPAFIYNSYSSNHFWWKNDFPGISETGMTLAYHDPGYKLTAGARMISVSNAVHLHDGAIPQSNYTMDRFGGYSAFLKKIFLLKHFGLNTSITWQRINASSDKTGKENFIHVPEFVTYNSLYYKGKWFKKAVDVQLGFDITYFTAYYADAYMPALGLYYWQNTQERGNYPYVDFFFNMRVKHARVFFKTEHLNSGFMGPYYLAPYMPAPDRSLKIGVSWSFYD